MKEQPKCNYDTFALLGKSFWLVYGFVFSRKHQPVCATETLKNEDKLIHLKLLRFHYQREDLKWARVGCSGQI